MCGLRSVSVSRVPRVARVYHPPHGIRSGHQNYSPVWLKHQSARYSSSFCCQAASKLVKSTSSAPDCLLPHIIITYGGRPHFLASIPAPEQTLLAFQPTLTVLPLTAGGIIQGDIMMNGYPKEQATFARVSGYVEQFDVHSPQTTVKEALLFSARLRTRGETSEVISAFVDEVMDLVELTPLRDGLVSSTCSVLCVHVVHMSAVDNMCATLWALLL